MITKGQRIEILTGTYKGQIMVANRDEFIGGNGKTYTEFDTPSRARWSRVETRKVRAV